MTDIQILIGISIALIIVIIAPLTFMYIKGPWPFRITIPSLLSIPILFCLIYTPWHELSHIAGLYLSGGWASYVQLYPKFVAGRIVTARYSPHDIPHAWQFLIMTGFPYILNVVSSTVGIIILRRSFFKNSFVAGFLFVLLCLRPIFDFTGETLGFLVGNGGDLCQIAMILGNFRTWLILIMSFVFALFSAFVILNRFTGFPRLKFGKATESRQ